VERALGVVLRVAASLTVAGRTDAGVHALGQVASYPGDPVPVGSLNAVLPPDIAALECVEAPPGFDARVDATSRAYCYRVLARPGRPALERARVLHWPHALDFAALEECAAALVGTHDFTAFTPTETHHVRFSRDVYAAYWRRAPEDVLEFWIEADAFMRHMNRVLVGTMLEVGSGRRGGSASGSGSGESSEAAEAAEAAPAAPSASSFRALLAGQPRSEAGPTAPAHGLYLAGVGYDGVRVLG